MKTRKANKQFLSSCVASLNGKLEKCFPIFWGILKEGRSEWTAARSCGQKGSWLPGSAVGEQALWAGKRTMMIGEG